jgi:organic radical activating enzyme
VIKKRFEIEINLSNTCNYSCSYCNDIFKSGNNFSPDFNYGKVKKLIDELSGFSIRAVILGGEVTYHKKIIEIVKFLKINGVEVIIMTNFSAKIDKLHLIEEAGASFLPTFHHEQMTLNDFIHKTKEIKSIKYITVMWESKFDKEITLKWRIIKDIFKKTYMMPTYPANMYNKENLKLERVELKKFEQKHRVEHPMISGKLGEKKWIDILKSNEDDFYGMECHFNMSHTSIDSDCNFYDCSMDYYVGNPSNTVNISRAITCKYHSCACEKETINTNIEQIEVITA